MPSGKGGDGRRPPSAPASAGENLEVSRDRWRSAFGDPLAESRSAFSRRARCSIAWSDPPSTCWRRNASLTIWRGAA
jgi:hypothetical protein